MGDTDTEANDSLYTRPTVNGLVSAQTRLECILSYPCSSDPQSNVGLWGKLGGRVLAKPAQVPGFHPQKNQSVKSCDSLCQISALSRDRAEGHRMGVVVVAVVLFSYSWE